MSSKEQLESKGIRATSQRIAILDYLRQTNDHPTAEQVKQAMEDRMPLANGATVYNSLKLFVTHGLVKELSFSAGQAMRYDGNTELHHHFFDQDSGEIIDLNKAQAKVTFDLPDAYQIDQVEVLVWGRQKPADSSATK